MKRFSVLMILICGLLTGCNATNRAGTSPAEETTRFVTRPAGGTNGMGEIATDTETGCQYLLVYKYGACLLVDKDGNPLLADLGEMKP